MILEVIPLGADVEFGPHKAVVLRIQLSPPLETPNIVYEIGYWHDHAWHEAWVNSFMVAPQTGNRLTIGFAPVKS